MSVELIATKTLAAGTFSPLTSMFNLKLLEFGSKRHDAFILSITISEFTLTIGKIVVFGLLTSRRGPPPPPPPPDEPPLPDGEGLGVEFSSHTAYKLYIEFA